MGNVTTDEDLIAERRKVDARRFLTNALNPDNAPRLAPALRAALDYLLAHGTVPYSAVLAEMLRASDLAVKTCDNQIRNAVECGYLQRTGEYSRTYSKRLKQWSTKDTRMIRLIEWPEEWPAE